jgi:micrococcal nuclease
MITRFSRFAALFVFVIGVGLSSSANAASLYGKVVEVSEGDTLAIFNMNRSVRVRLLGVDAPEMKQPFAEVSRQHLSDLVLGKFVTVEYSGLSSGSIVGKVMLDKTDICAQMVRDGAAWFNGKLGNVGEPESQIYQQSEVAARQERRGLWQDENPIAPWEFVRAEIERRKPVGAKASPTPIQEIRRANSSSLDNETIRFAGLPARNLRTPKFEVESELIWANDSPDETWKTMQPRGEQLSVFAPTDGQHDVFNIPFGVNSVESHTYFYKNGQTFIQLAWVTRPALGETDDEVLTMVFTGLMQTLTIQYQQFAGDGSLLCKTRKSTPLSMGGFAGREVDLSNCNLPGLVRIFTRVEGSKRTVYAAIGLHRPTADPGEALDFVRSIKVGTAMKPLVAKKK